MWWRGAPSARPAARPRSRVVDARSPCFRDTPGRLTVLFLTTVPVLSWMASPASGFRRLDGVADTPAGRSVGSPSATTPASSSPCANPLVELVETLYRHGSDKLNQRGCQGEQQVDVADPDAQRSPVEQPQPGPEPVGG